MRMTTVGRWRIAAAASLFGLGLLHCTFGNLDGLGAGSTDAGVPQESGGAATDVASSDDTDASAGDTGRAGDTGSRDADASPGAADSSVTDGAQSGLDAGDAAPDGPSVPASALPSWHEAGAPSWCTTYGFGSAFCADFDEVPLPSGFDLSDGDFLALTSSSAQPDSLANDLLLYAPPQTGSGLIVSKLSRQFDTYTSSIVLSFDVLPEYINTTASGILFAALDFTQKGVSAEYSLRLAYNASAPRLEESYLLTTNAPGDIYHKNFTLPVGVWSRVQVNINFVDSDGGSADAGNATEVISVGGVVQGAAEVLTPPPGFDSRPILRMGAVYGTGPTSGWAIRYDNVLLTLQ